MWGARRAPDRGGIINDARQRPFLPMWGGFDLSVAPDFFLHPHDFLLVAGCLGEGLAGVGG